MNHSAGLFAAALVAQAAPSPAAAFLDAWAKIDGYTVTIAVHETNGKDVQDRVYHYSYAKPHEATIEVVEGPEDDLVAES